MLEVPNYGMFESDLTYLTNIQLIKIRTDEILDRFSKFCAAQLIKAYETALRESIRAGIKVKAVLICNPCNPIGRCYSRDTLVKIAQFCARHSLHLISDEIYALSAREGTGRLDGFTSVLSLPSSTCISSKNIHVLSGASKDFGLGGLRLGWIITRNTLVWQTVRRLG